MHLNKNDAQRIIKLKEQTADIEARLPVHSVPPSMIQELEDLEEEFEQLKKEQEE